MPFVLVPDETSSVALSDQKMARLKHRCRSDDSGVESDSAYMCRSGGAWTGSVLCCSIWTATIVAKITAGSYSKKGSKEHYIQHNP